MRYYVHIPAPQEICSLIDARQAAWGYESKSRPHITLCIPGRLKPGVTEGDLINVFQESVAGLKPFPVVMEGIGFFRNKEVIFISIQQTDEIRACYQVLNDALNSYLDNAQSDNFHPHITLIKDITSEKGAQLLQELKDEEWGGLFIAESLELLKRGPEDPKWEVVCSRGLGK
jgi:2'-5' RNA ligase